MGPKGAGRAWREKGRERSEKEANEREGGGDKGGKRFLNVENFALVSFLLAGLLFKENSTKLSA